MEKGIKRFVSPEIRDINEQDRTIDFVISTESRDTYDTVFKLDGWQLSRYASNPIVTYNHMDFSNDPDMVIGTSEVRIEGGALIARATFESADLNEIADKVFRKIQAGTLRMASIMAEAIEGSFGSRDAGEDPKIFYFRKQELYSWSVVTHGSNPEALKRSAEMAFIEKNTKNEFNISNRADDFDARYLTLKYK